MEKIGTSTLSKSPKSEVVSKRLGDVSPKRRRSRGTIKERNGELYFLTTEGTEYRIKPSSKAGVYHISDKRGTGFVIREGNTYTLVEYE